ncbi:hypothetical protein, partial [Vibrio parahaemolyticus]|uniref:hypothetical protein n=1 Tax=Vibrio parahaemolyticus TaxID=670 RepID=UPI001C5E9192
GIISSYFSSNYLSKSISLALKLSSEVGSPKVIVSLVLKKLTNSSLLKFEKSKSPRIISFSNGSLKASTLLNHKYCGAKPVKL